MPPHITEKPNPSDNLQHAAVEPLPVVAPNLQGAVAPNPAVVPNIQNPFNVAQNEMVAPELEARSKCSAYKSEFWWQNFKKCPKDRLSYLLDNGIMSDVTLEFQDDVVVRCHKLILMMYSPVYATSFLGSFKKSDIIVENTTSTTFAWVASFMYKGIFTISNYEMAISIYEFAHEKQMECIVKICRTYLLSHVRLENVFQILETAVLYSDKKLKDECTKIIFKRRGSVFMTDESNIMTMNAFRELILEGHEKCSDSMFFQKIHSWAIAKVKEEEGSVSPESLQNKMLPLVSLLDFKNISIEFIIKEVLSTNILSPEDCILILRRKVGVTVSNPRFMQNEIPLRKIRFENKSTKIIQLNLFHKPYGCDVSFHYNHFDETYTGKLFQITCSESIYLRGIKALQRCYYGAWKLFITDPSDNQVGSLSCEGPPWHFKNMIPLSPTKKYKGSIIGKGRFNKHRTSMFEESLCGISFAGEGLSCGMSLLYHVKK